MEEFCGINTFWNWRSPALNICARNFSLYALPFWHLLNRTDNKYYNNYQAVYSIVTKQEPKTLSTAHFLRCCATIAGEFVIILFIMRFRLLLLQSSRNIVIKVVKQRPPVNHTVLTKIGYLHNSSQIPDDWHGESWALFKFDVYHEPYCSKLLCVVFYLGMRS